MTSDASPQQSVDWETMIQQYDGQWPHRPKNQHVPIWRENVNYRFSNWSLLRVDYAFSILPFAEDSEYRSTHSWGDRVETEDFSRTPGKAVHMHEKLSSPSRKRSVESTPRKLFCCHLFKFMRKAFAPSYHRLRQLFFCLFFLRMNETCSRCLRSITESHKRHEEKQQKAKETRTRLLQQKAERLRALTKKVLENRGHVPSFVLIISRLFWSSVFVALQSLCFCLI